MFQPFFIGVDCLVYNNNLHIIPYKRLKTKHPALLSGVFIKMKSQKTTL